MVRFPQVQALAFDVFDTILDLDGSLTPPLQRFLALSNADPEFLDHLVKHQVQWEFDEETPYQPDVTVGDFAGLADALV